MIKILSLKVREFRGIRDATFPMDGKNFVVCGPNGSGKSGAIQFALTGEIGRLTGAGTGDLKLAEHGPHVTQRHQPDRAVVDLTVQIPALRKNATITRSIAEPRQPIIVPEDDDVKAVFAELETHPEITLARRDIIKLILTRGTERSRAVQTLLHQDEIDRTRKTLKTTENKVGDALAEARRRTSFKTEALQRQLRVGSIKADNVLEAVNSRRRTLGLGELTVWTKDTVFSAGIQDQASGDGPAQGKASALVDLHALADATRDGTARASDDALRDLLAAAGRFESDPRLLLSLKEADLTQAGLGLLFGPFCPLCDAEWDLTKLRRHLGEKLAKAGEARALRKRLLDSASQVAGDVEQVRSLIKPISAMPGLSRDAIDRLRGWDAGLSDLAKDLMTVEGVMARKDGLNPRWAVPSASVSTDLEELRAKVFARPEKGAIGDARDFLVVAQERFADLQQAKRAEKQAESDAGRARLAYRIYCEVSESALRALYKELEADFVAYYRALNPDDEAEFKASLSPSEGALDLSVDFHKKGMFPPGAYHSEGHQDGMGLCLYLALLKHVLGTGFTLGVLDDVVMSVDSEHRRRICKIIRSQFPETQFVITTHDQVWASQMKSQGLVDGNRMVAFNAWSIDTGPVINEVAEVWQYIEADLARGDVASAAAHLRRYAEFASRELAHNLGAKVSFKADGSYELGELLPAVLKRYGELLTTAAKVARSWDNAEDLKRIEEASAKQASLRQAHNIEQWAVNKALHYNEWANFTVPEFKDVVSAFRDLISQFQCSRPGCNSWLVVTPHVDPQDLRCACDSLRFNLRKK